MYRLIAIDMDGTFLNGKHQISDENIAAVKAAQEKGIKVVIVSGRQHKSIKEFLNRHGLECDAVGLNGAEFLDHNGKEIYIQWMEKESIKAVIDLCEGEKAIYQIYNSEHIITNELQDPFNEFKKIVKMHNPNAENLLERTEMFYKGIYDGGIVEKDVLGFLQKEGMGAIKMLILSHDEEKLIRIQERLSQREDLTVTSSFRGNLEIFHSNTDKGIALLQIAKELGIKKEETMAIGDNLNDIRMITEAGLGVAMGNALEAVKQKADFITKTNNENGVAYAIKKFVL
ncbi:MAG: HAD family phosphatase [Epulopiscium sp.]|nr:HAD family phosphatase [Candidatus Epulonipiscium sp.]